MESFTSQRLADCPSLQQFRQHLISITQEVECHERGVPMDERMTEASVDKNKTIALALRHCNSITFEKETKKTNQRKRTQLKKTSTVSMHAQHAKKDSKKTK